MNPFRILEIELTAESPEIMKAVVTVLKKKKYSARQIAEAQKILLHPQKRIYATATHFLPPEKQFAESEWIPGMIMLEFSSKSQSSNSENDNSSFAGSSIDNKNQKIELISIFDKV
ncbi:MAG: hypothetical protein K8S23_07430 [Candidatus Cloacimonetes bacterium]|nr:hypothetical protein [Candidatus Cloacimonadota bacterium]